MNKAVDGVGTERYIHLATGGKVFLREERDLQEVEKEMQAFNTILQNHKPGEELMEPPAMFKDTEASISDISVGDSVFVKEDGKEDLRLEETVNATSITVFKSNRPLLPEPQLIQEPEQEPES